MNIKLSAVISLLARLRSVGGLDRILDMKAVSLAGTLIASVVSLCSIAEPNTLGRGADWFRKGVIYQVQMRAFTPEGTLKAAAAKLPHVKATGANIAYLCPIWVSDDDPDRTGWSPRQLESGTDNPRSPYRLKDYAHVDPEYGTDADFKAFVDAAHALGLKVMTDLVFRHCGPNAVFLKEHPDWVLRKADGSPEVVAKSFPVPKLNFASRELRDHLIDVMVRETRDFGVDGFRTDMSDSVPLDFWAEARAAVERVKPDIAMLAEGVRPANLEKVFDANYGHFTSREGLMPVLYGGRLLKYIIEPGMGKDGVQSFRRMFEKEFGAIPKGGLLVNFTENHDTANEGFADRAEKILGHANQAAGLAVIFALPGVPMVYNGQEICDESRHSIFGRMGIDWSKAATPAAVERMRILRELARLRATHPALTSSNVRWLENDRPKEIVSFVREDGADRVRFLANLSAAPVKVTVGGCETLALAPWQYVFD